MKNEITIEITNVNKSPKVTINGKDIKSIIDLKYNYETLNNENNGIHRYTISYYDQDLKTIRQVTASKIT